MVVWVHFSCNLIQFAEGFIWTIKLNTKDPKIVLVDFIIIISI